MNERNYDLNANTLRGFKSLDKMIDSLSAKINFGRSRTAILVGDFSNITNEQALKIINSRHKGKGIKQIFSNNPTTVILWEDGTKTISKCSDNDVYNVERGIEICMIKKAFGMSNQEYKRYMAYANRKVGK